MQTWLLMKLFNTGSVDIVHECCVMFNIRSLSSLIVCRRQAFLTKFMDNRNSICGAVSGLARRELNDLIWLYTMQGNIHWRIFRLYMYSVHTFVALWSKYTAGCLNKFRPSYFKCIKLLFGYNRCDSGVTQILSDKRLPTFNTVILPVLMYTYSTLLHT